MAGKLCVNIKQEMTEKPLLWKERVQRRAEHTMLKEWAFMCFAITEETNETLHSALGSSGRSLVDKERDSGYKL